tara:strand:+ start:3907 stop:4230 length:324 start_codon:yes stop_codon:yes gene_type:complete
MSDQQQNTDRYEENKVDINNEYYDGGFFNSKNVVNSELNDNYYNNLLKLLEDASTQVKNYEAANTEALNKQKLFENAYEDVQIAEKKKREAALALTKAMKSIQKLNL